jgi:hypothetical protein
VSVRFSVRSLASLFAGLLAIGTAAQAQQQGDTYTIWPKWAPFLDLDAKVGTQRDIGETDLFVPLWQNDKSMLFGDFRFRADNQNSNEGNFGAGYRQMLDGGWNIGGYSYYDHRHSSTGNLFDQLTFGGELLGRDFDVRANLYSPIGQTQQLLNTTSMGPATAQVVGSSLQVTEPGILATFEYALRGFDAEAGVRIPITAAESPYALRFYAGGYRFDEPTGVVPVVSGPRLRLEFTDYDLPVWNGSRLSAELDWQTDPVRGSQFFGGLRLRIPLWSEPKRSTMTMQERRMTDPVVRDVDIVAQTATVQQTPTIAETATTLANGTKITGISSANVSGADLAAAITNAGHNSFVVLGGNFNLTNGPIVVLAGQTVMGGGPLTLRTTMGQVVTVSMPGATITAANGGTSVALIGSNSSLIGLTINSPGSAINIDVAEANTIANNTIVASVEGILAVGMDNGVITGNSITTTSGNSLGIRLLGSSALVSGNTLSSNNVGALLMTSTIAPGSTGNVLVSGTCQDKGGNTGMILFTNGTHCP